MYIGGGNCPEDNKMEYVYAYYLEENRWEGLPPLQQHGGVPVNIADKLNIIGGCNSYTYKVTPHVTTFSNSNWRNDIFPNLLIARHCPAVVPYQSYIIVVGGYGAADTVLNSIEVFDTSTLQWRIVNTYLPQPMGAPSAAVCGKSLVIVGFDTADKERSNETFVININKIIAHPKHKTFPDDSRWSNLSNAPYWCTALLPNSSLPIIIGGSDEQGKATNDITLYDDVTESWRRVSSLPISCACSTVTIINNLVIVSGGCGNPGTSVSAQSTSLTNVVMGHLVEFD